MDRSLKRMLHAHTGHGFQFSSYTAIPLYNMNNQHGNRLIGQCADETDLCPVWAGGALLGGGLGLLAMVSQAREAGSLARLYRHLHVWVRVEEHALFQVPGQDICTHKSSILYNIICVGAIFYLGYGMGNLEGQITLDTARFLDVSRCES